MGNLETINTTETPELSESRLTRMERALDLLYEASRTYHVSQMTEGMRDLAYQIYCEKRWQAEQKGAAS